MDTIYFLLQIYSQQMFFILYYISLEYFICSSFIYLNRSNLNCIKSCISQSLTYFNLYCYGMYTLYQYYHVPLRFNCDLCIKI